MRLQPTSLGALAVLIAPSLFAALPPISAGELRKGADVVVIAQVDSIEVTQRRHGTDDADSVYALRLRVISAEKGATDKSIVATGWQILSRPPGWVGPAGVGGIDAIEPGHRVRLYLTTNNDGRFEVMQPNGLERISDEPHRSNSETPSGVGPPRFEDYDPYLSVCGHEDVTVPPDRLTAQYRSAVISQSKGEPNYSGCWHAGEVGCGTQCQLIFIRHAPSGKVIWAGTASAGFDSRVDSGLLVLNPLDEGDGGSVRLDYEMPKYFILGEAESGELQLLPISQPN